MCSALQTGFIPPFSYSTTVLNAVEAVRRRFRRGPDSQTLEKLKGTWLDPSFPAAKDGAQVEASISETSAEQAAQRSVPARRTVNEEGPLSQWQRCVAR